MSQDYLGYEAIFGRRLPDAYVQLLDTLERLDVYTHETLINYPKYERFLLCAAIRRSMNEIERLIVSAWLKYHKKTTFRDLDIEKAVLMRWVAKSRRLGHITPGKAVEWTKIIALLGKQVGGWKKHWESNNK